MKDTLHCTIFWWGQIPTCGEPTCSGNADGHPFTEIKCNRLRCLNALSSHPWQSEFGSDRILICPTSQFCTRNLGDTTGHSPPASFAGLKQAMRNHSSKLSALNCTCEILVIQLFCSSSLFKDILSVTISASSLTHFEWNPAW